GEDQALREVAPADLARAEGVAGGIVRHVLARPRHRVAGVGGAGEAVIARRGMRALPGLADVRRADVPIAGTRGSGERLTPHGGDAGVTRARVPIPGAGNLELALVRHATVAPELVAVLAVLTRVELPVVAAVRDGRIGRRIRWWLDHRALLDRHHAVPRGQHVRAVGEEPSARLERHLACGERVGAQAGTARVERAAHRERAVRADVDAPSERRAAARHVECSAHDGWSREVPEEDRPLLPRTDRAGGLD